MKLANPLNSVREEIHQLRREMKEWFGPGGSLGRTVGREVASRQRENESMT